MFSLLKKEVSTFLNSLTGYISIWVFLITIGLFLWVFPGAGFNVPEAGYASIDSLFVITPWVYMFLIPAITMRLFSEERKSGTIELLLTKPLTELQIILAKYFAGVILVLFSLLPTFVYFYTIYDYALPQGNVDTGAITGSYIGLFLLGAGFVAIGLFASSLTDNQVIAFIIALFFCFFCYAGFESLSEILPAGPLSVMALQLSINTHYSSISRGVIDTRDVIYYLSLISFFIMLTKLKLESRKW